MEKETFDVLGVNISAVNLDKAFGLIEGWIKNRARVYVCVAPVSTVMFCQDNEEYKKVVNNAAMVTPDGMPLVWIARKRGMQSVERTYGPDLMVDVCGRGHILGFKHYFLGGSKRVNELLLSVLSKRFPGINIVGGFSPPFSDTIAEDPELVERINIAAPDILWVGLGSPKQDFWMAKYRDNINAPVMIGVGAAFDFLSGVKKQAPVWIQRSGLEWLFRLFCEPKRLWRRYFFGNIKFMWLLIFRNRSRRR